MSFNWTDFHVATLLGIIHEYDEGEFYQNMNVDPQRHHFYLKGCWSGITAIFNEHCEEFLTKDQIKSKWRRLNKEHKSNIEEMMLAYTIKEERRQDKQEKHFGSAVKQERRQSKRQLDSEHRVSGSGQIVQSVTDDVSRSFLKRKSEHAEIEHRKRLQLEEEVAMARVQTEVQLQQHNLEIHNMKKKLLEKLIDRCPVSDVTKVVDAIKSVDSIQTVNKIVHF